MLQFWPICQFSPLKVLGKTEADKRAPFDPFYVKSVCKSCQQINCRNKDEAIKRSERRRVLNHDVGFWVLRSMVGIVGTNQWSNRWSNSCSSDIQLSA